MRVLGMFLIFDSGGFQPGGAYVSIEGDFSARHRSEFLGSNEVSMAVRKASFHLIGSPLI